jgi:YHS domain-containing protein
MNKSTLYTIIVALLVLGVSVQAQAMTPSHSAASGQLAQAESTEKMHMDMHMDNDTVTQSSLQPAINVGNKICPVTGEKIEEQFKATYEYEGKIYNFCCAGCIEEFKKDPQKYIKKVEEELKASGQQESAEPKEQPHMMQMMNETGQMHQGHMH